MDTEKIHELKRKMAEADIDGDELRGRYDVYSSIDDEAALHQLRDKLGAIETAADAEEEPLHVQRQVWRVSHLLRYAAAAAVIVAIFGGLFWYRQYTAVEPPVLSQQMLQAMEQSQQSGRTDGIRPQPLKPHDKTSITGESSAPADEWIEEVVEMIQQPAASEQLAVLSIDTRESKEYWLTLPDGSVVHLNNGTRVIYPEQFVGDNRDVILDGEAYFMVAKDKSRQFVVHTPQGEIRVYGTEFWVKTDYKATAPRANEDAATGETTGQTGETVVALVRGTIGFTPADGREQMLKPGQELTAVNSQLTVTDVDTTPYTAWNTGLFVFENSTLEHLMDVLAQWYDIKKVNYTDDKLRKIHFTGNLKRYGSAERIMKAIMMACDVNIVLQNDTLSVGN